MKMFTSPSQIIKRNSPAFAKSPVEHGKMVKFVDNLSLLLEQTKNNEHEHEEHHKNNLADFLKTTYYSSTNNAINTKWRNDLVICDGEVRQDNSLVIIENKSPTNKSEMITTSDINKKALQELVWYYLNELKQSKGLTNLIITNNYEWFIFDSKSFYSAFKNLQGKLKLGKENSTEYFYKEVASPAIAKVIDKLDYTYFDLREYKKELNAKLYDNKKLVDLYKLLSPEFLLKLPFVNNSNSLNKNFYKELLHIIGLEEQKDGSKIKINRKKNPDYGSLLENCIYKLETYGVVTSNLLFDDGLELIITWINRVLFLKLLEAQLISYSGGDKTKAFLNKKVVATYNDLEKLFFAVLAKPVAERSSLDLDQFPNIPYLNSTLFEPIELERSGCRISTLDDSNEISILSNTVLKDEKGKRLTGKKNTLEYLFEFLDAYNFASDSKQLVQNNQEESNLINAAVLGLIFEKINGYKDGSFYTPSFITQYMCRETIRKAVLDKFKPLHENIKDFESLQAYVANFFEIDKKQEFIKIINSITICDPAVGSGHFLVSALNELIAIKSELGLLVDNKGLRLPIEVEVINDELVVYHYNHIFTYQPTKNDGNKDIQKALFHEKQTIIESCLFGVDINPNSVKICRLRLWIELLKNAYYKDDKLIELETLPNIDINIKCGNSLISRFDLNADVKNIIAKSKIKIKEYKQLVRNYKNAKLKIDKNKFNDAINQIKSSFFEGYQQDLFDMDSDKIALLNKSAFYKEQNAFEWRFEFPEVLAENGDYVGFDIVIGNPPYISNKDVPLEHKAEYQERYKLSDDLYNYFFTQSFKIAKKDGYSMLITSNTFMTINSKLNIRRLLQSKQLIEFMPIKNCFEEAAVEPIIVLCQNTENKNNYSFNYTDLRQLDFKPYENRLSVAIDIYRNTPSQVFFTPTLCNLQVYSKYISKAKLLLDEWWDKIENSAKITKNKKILDNYKNNLQAGDVTILGLVTDGGQGLATGENSKYLAVREDAKEAVRVRETRAIKLSEINKQFNQNYSINNLSELQIRVLFESIKAQYGRNIFGQGYIYSIALLDEIADVNLLTDNEKVYGINSCKSFVPYDKGDKDGNKWYVETSFVINWSCENVAYLKANSGKKGQGMPVVRNSQFYFREGFCWILTLNESSQYLKSRIKFESVFDVNAMSLFSTTRLISSKYIVMLLNSFFMYDYKVTFLNSTSAFQINDARQIPIVVPTQEQLFKFESIFDEAVSIRKDEISNTISVEQAKIKLSNIQKQVDEMVYQLYDLNDEEAVVESE